MAREAKSSTKRYPFEPDYAVAPGETLQETIDALGMDQRELATRTGLSPKHINLIVKGKAPVTYDTANLLERVTGVPARVWNNLEMDYREQVAKRKAKARLEEQLAWLKDIPTTELIKRGKLEKQPDKTQLLREVLGFFGVASVAAWKRVWLHPTAAFRKSPAFKGKAGAMATWLRLGESEALAIPCRPFNKARFRAALGKIRGLTIERPEVFVSKLKDLCASAGVAVVLVPEIKGAPASGATQWLTPSKAMIQLSLRHKSNDHFWFSFFHEAGHILYDGKKEKFIDNGYSDDEREQRANRFAANHLIPPGRVPELLNLKSLAAMCTFARSLGIAPGIVVGRLQHETEDYRRFNSLKLRFQWG